MIIHLCRFVVIYVIISLFFKSICRADISHPSTLISCDRGNKITLKNKPRHPYAHKIIGNFIYFYPSAEGEYKIECNDQKRNKRNTYMLDIVPYSFKFELDNGHRLGFISPIQDVYRLGDKIICQSSLGWTKSKWTFLFASKNNHIPYIYSSSDLLFIDMNFLASVEYFFECDGRHIRFTVIRETYHMELNYSRESDPRVLSCSAKGSNITYFWKINTNIVEKAILPVEGNRLVLKNYISNAYHQVTCVAVSAYDGVEFRTIEFYHNLLDKDEKMFWIVAPKKYYFQHESIECASSVRDHLTDWNCSIAGDTKKKFKIVLDNTLHLSDSYFSSMNGFYICACRLKMDPSTVIDTDVVHFFMRDKKKLCNRMRGRFIRKLMEIVCLSLILLSALGPFRFLNNFVMHCRDSRRYAPRILRRK